MSIATKTGDRGTTGLMYNRRVSKCHPRVEAYGTVDELNAALGLARAAGAEARSLVYNSPRPMNALFGVVRNHGIGLVVFGPNRKSYGRWRYRWHLRRIRRGLHTQMVPLLAVFAAFSAVDHPLLLKKGILWRVFVVRSAKEVFAPLARLAYYHTGRNMQ